MVGVRADLAVSQQVAGEYCRAELEQLKSSSGSLGSFDQSESTVQEHRKPNVSAVDASSRDRSGRPFRTVGGRCFAGDGTSFGFIALARLERVLHRRQDPAGALRTVAGALHQVDGAAVAMVLSTEPSPGANASGENSNIAHILAT